MNTTEQAAYVIGKHMSRWDMAGRPDVDGGIDMAIAKALAAAGLIVSEAHQDAQKKAWDEGCNWAIEQLPASSPWPEAWNHDGNPYRTTIKAAA